MAVNVTLDVSEAQYEDQGNGAPIPLHQPANVVLRPFADNWVQMTYNTLRAAPDGDEIAYFADGFWIPAKNWTVVSATFSWGAEVPSQILPGLQVSQMKFSDISISYNGN